jgi:hypothetical protein
MHGFGYGCSRQAEQYFTPTRDAMNLNYIFENVGQDVWNRTPAPRSRSTALLRRHQPKSLDINDKTDAMIVYRDRRRDLPRGIYTPFPVIPQALRDFCKRRPSTTLPKSSAHQISTWYCPRADEGLDGHEEDLGRRRLHGQVAHHEAASKKSPGSRL